MESPRHKRLLIGLQLTFGLCLTVRLLPYLAPIQAKDLIQDRQAIEFRDRHQVFLGTLLTRDQSHTAFIPLKQVSPHFVQAILAAEDGRFYQHGPLDLWAIGRALRDSLQAGRIQSGASTITMQLARMLNPFPNNVSGKVQEVWFAWRLAAGLNHDQILEAYINRLPMGGNIYGVEAASRVYFGISARDLNVAQASLLAALPNEPTYLNPYNNWPALKTRQRYVLRRMVQEKYLTLAQSQRIAQEQVTLQSRNQGIQAAPHFLFWVAAQLPPQSPSTLQTTLDLPLQIFVEAQVKAVVRSLYKHQGHQAAALVIDNHTGEVLAYVGSADYYGRSHLGENDGVQALRQPGSALKPFLYQLALENRRIRPNTILADVPTHYAIPGGRLYSPLDYSENFQGPVRVRIALANSLNVPAVRILEQVGLPPFLERLHQLGFNHLNQPATHYGLGLSLGSGEVSLWELARAYVTLARQGEIPTLKVISAPQPEQSNPTAAESSDSSPSPQRIGAAATWALITDMLSDPHARARSFGVDSVLQLPFPAAVKTGTSSNYRDTWTVGFTSDYTVATWVGNFRGERMQKVSGVTGSAPLWNRIMLHLHQQRSPAPFAAPEGMVQKPICALSGWKPTPACPTIVQEYFAAQDLAEYEHHPDPVYPEDHPAAARKTSSPSRLNLSPEYDQWLASQGNLGGAGRSLRIAFPRQGDFFWVSGSALDKGSNATTRLEFKLTTLPEKPVEWRLNGQVISTQPSDSLFWPLRPGTWTLQVQSGQQSDQVQFEVASAPLQPQRPGFSILNSGSKP
jgi:penicillin-binding protein 1C